MTKQALEKLFWSIAFPGFGQLLNRQYIKGTIFIVLEIWVNVKSNFNLAIISSFHGHPTVSFEQIHVKWLLLYPCLYFWSMWDAVKHTDKNDYSPLMFLPYIFAAFFVTMGLIYSMRAAFFTLLLGPVFFPMLMAIPGVLSGLAVKKILAFILMK